MIGINTAIFSPSGAYAGIGFAVPVDTVNRVVPELISKGRYTRPSLGVSVDVDVSRMVTRRLGVRGVLVLEVHPGSGAAAAGLRGTRIDARGELIPGDIILAIDGKPVADLADLLAVLDDYQDGDSVSVRVWRSDKERELTLVLQSEFRPADERRRRP